jgi:hypothetical protein
MKKLNLLRDGLVAGVVGVSAGLVSYGLLNDYIPDSKQNIPSHVYHIDADGSGEGHDDLVVGYENGNAEVYLRNTEGKFESVEGLRAGELADVEKRRKSEFGDLGSWHNSQVREIESNFEGIREQLK